MSVKTPLAFMQKTVVFLWKMSTSISAVSSSFSRFGRNATILHDIFPDVEPRGKETIPICWLKNVSSTMDVAKELLSSPPDPLRDHELFAVVAENQRKGRGTHGRQWLSGQKNLYLTLVVSRSALPPIPLTLTPLRVGTLIASAIQARVTSGAQVKLKWPNDVLISGKKVLSPFLPPFTIDAPFYSSLHSSSLSLFLLPDLRGSHRNGRRQVVDRNRLQRRL